MILTVGDLRRALRDVPDGALLSLDVAIKGLDVTVGFPSVESADLSEPDDLGFETCVIRAELPFADIATTEVLGRIPRYVLEGVLATGRVPAVEDVEDER